MRAWSREPPPASRDHAVSLPAAALPHGWQNLLRLRLRCLLEESEAPVPAEDRAEGRLDLEPELPALALDLGPALSGAQGW